MAYRKRTTRRRTGGSTGRKGRSTSYGGRRRTSSRKRAAAPKTQNIRIVIEQGNPGGFQQVPSHLPPGVGAVQPVKPRQNKF